MQTFLQHFSIISWLGVVGQLHKAAISMLEELSAVSPEGLKPRASSLRKGEALLRTKPWPHGV